jgi:alpha 1,2-mannosyltransferase
MGDKGIVYGGSESYRFMCRYFSGFFYRHPLLQPFDYYWRVEPGVEFSCNVNYDVFRFMASNRKKYGFVITMQEIAETIPTLWKTITEEFLPRGPRFMGGSSKPAIRYFGPPSPNGYNGCHFWSNFEIASFDFFRSPEYNQYFELLDRKGGFFYERWGDAPVHSIAAGLFLSTEEIHYFHDIGYRHYPFSHCPADFVFRRENDCACDPFEPTEISHGICQTMWDIHYAL